MEQLKPNIPTKEELSPVPKKTFWSKWKKTLIFVSKFIGLRTKGIKGNAVNEGIVKEVAEILGDLGD